MIRLENIHHAYPIGRSGSLPVLRGIDLEILPEQSLAIRGASGSGKSTLLQILGGLDRPTSGQVIANGRDLAGLSPGALARWRGLQVGFVFQSYHLMPELDVWENVALPAWLAGLDHTARARELIDEVGLSDRLRHRPGELSGGEQQRAALARALVNDPALVLADEPTGNLDSENREIVLKLLLDLTRQRKKALVLVTHDIEVAARASRVLELRHGILTERQQ
ncbi:MAG: ABC transporter ATP-binding protein [Candidatus Methylacidiphilales bacterium]|nr:ABC transporter ATP-binding protein [Candidatus Methylacidiphilales bacterium]